MDFINIAKKAKKAALKIAQLNNETKNAALIAMANALNDNQEEIFEANKADLEIAQELLKDGKLVLSLPLFVLALPFLVCSTIALCFMAKKPLIKLLEQITEE